MSFDQHRRLESAKRLLAQTSVIRTACDLDVMLFLHRYPRTLLTSEQLAGLVGYPLKGVAKALDTFIEAGLLERTTQQSVHAARMFVLLLDGPQGGGARALLELGSTREGREDVLEALRARVSRLDPPHAHRKLQLVQSV